MARRTVVCTSHKWPTLSLKSKQASSRLATTLPHMARLWPAYLMRHGPFLARLVFSNEKACGPTRFVNSLPRRLSIDLRTRTIRFKGDHFSRGIISYDSWGIRLHEGIVPQVQIDPAGSI